jgi:hypothetical protein
MILRPLLFSLTLLIALRVSATNYFVATNGNDSAAGTSTNAPWRTVQHAANALAPGDTAFVRGGLYSEAVTVNVSGSAASGYVRFQNYPGELPILDGTSLTVPTTNNGMFLLIDRSYVAIQGFEIRNYRTSTKNIVPAGFHIRGASHDLTIRSNRVHHIETNYGSSSGGDAFGIIVYGTSTTQPVTNLVIQGNEIYSLKTGSSETLTVNGNVNGFDISYNSVHDNNNIGIDFIGFEGTCPDANQDFARNGICRGNTVWNISSYGNFAYGNNYGADGIYSDGGSNVLVELNKVFACDIGVELASEHAGRASKAIECRNNLIWSNRVVGIYIGGYSTSVGRTENCRITHNTLYHNDTLHQGNGEWGLQFDTRTNTFSHNIVVANSQNLLIGNQFTQNSGNVVDWNIYFAPGGAGASDWEWKKTTYSTFATWKSGTANDAHSLFADPQFVNAGLANFHLATNSPAVNAGDTNFVAAPGEQDIDGQPRVFGGRTDIGADELGALAPTLGIAPQPANQIALQLNGEPGHDFVWEQSSTLTNWTPFATNTAWDGSVQITQAAPGTAGFFRARFGL